MLKPGPADASEVHESTGVLEWLRTCLLTSIARKNGAETLKEKLTMAQVHKSTDSSSLAEVVDRILDKGIVIDVWAKVSLVGIELLSVEARVVIASVETYLKYAEAIGLTATAAAPA
jgi:hypothetical protein